MKWNSAGRRVEVLSLDRTALTGAYGVVVLMLFQPKSAHITSLSMNNYGITGKHARQGLLYAGPFPWVWIRALANLAHTAEGTTTHRPPFRRRGAFQAALRPRDDGPGRFPRGIGRLACNALNCYRMCKAGGTCGDPVQKN